MNRVVIYHNNCYDGITAAYVCYLKFGDADTMYLPMNYSDVPPDVTGKEVIMVDFSFKRPIMDDILSKAKILLVMDHHKTAQAELEGFPNTVFDMNRSGAGIAWDHLFGSQRPALVNYVEDRDLWLYKLPYSREINALIQSYDIDLNIWESVVGPRLMNISISDFDNLADEGSGILRKQNSLVKTIASYAYPRKLAGLTGIYVTTNVLFSEVCEQMLLDHPEYGFSFYSFRRNDGKIQYGLRSRSSEDFDVSELAKKFNGGGHKHAAGFELDGEIE